MCETPRTFHTRGLQKLCIETKIHVPSVSGVHDFIPRLLSFLRLMILFHVTIMLSELCMTLFNSKTDIFLACLVGIIDQRRVKQKANLMQNCIYCIIPAYLSHYVYNENLKCDTKGNLFLPKPRTDHLKRMRFYTVT